MALIKCPECEQSVSDKASKCPKCGYPIQEYLSQKVAETKAQNSNDASAQDETFADMQQIPIQKVSKKENIIATFMERLQGLKLGVSKKKLIIAAIVASIVVVAVLGIVIASQFFASRLTVEDISVSKWRLTNSTKYGDYYEGTITSEQKRPFIAVIGEYEDDEAAPQFVYVEDGTGVIETYEDTDEDPSIKYRAIGYIGGKAVELSDMKVKYKDSDYYDWSYSDYTSCDVLISIEMNTTKTGLLVFDVINETSNETDRNMIAVVIDGKAEYSYYANLPYKARGVDVSIIPKLFCESAAITAESYVIEKEYTAEKSETSYSNSYSGEETLAFADYADGFVLYTRELKEGGNKENRNVVRNMSAFLFDGECTLTTYDSVDEDETILMPKYEFNIVGYITWTPLEKETV